MTAEADQAQQVMDAVKAKAQELTTGAVSVAQATQQVAKASKEAAAAADEEAKKIEAAERAYAQYLARIETANIRAIADDLNRQNKALEDQAKQVRANEEAYARYLNNYEKAVNAAYIENQKFDAAAAKVAGTVQNNLVPALSNSKTQFYEAYAATQLLGREIGVNIPFSVAKLIGQSKELGPLMTQVFSVAAIGFAAVAIEQVAMAAYHLWQNLSHVKAVQDALNKANEENRQEQTREGSIGSQQKALQDLYSEYDKLTKQIEHFSAEQHNFNPFGFDPQVMKNKGVLETYQIAALKMVNKLGDERLKVQEAITKATQHLNEMETSEAKDAAGVAAQKYTAQAQLAQQSKNYDEAARLRALAAQSAEEKEIDAINKRFGATLRGSEQEKLKLQEIADVKARFAAEAEAAKVKADGEDEKREAKKLKLENDRAKFIAEWTARDERLIDRVNKKLEEETRLERTEIELQNKIREAAAKTITQTTESVDRVTKEEEKTIERVLEKAKEAQLQTEKASDRVSRGKGIENKRQQVEEEARDSIQLVRLKAQENIATLQQVAIDAKAVADIARGQAMLAQAYGASAAQIKQSMDIAAKAEENYYETVLRVQGAVAKVKQDEQAQEVAIGKAKDAQNKANLKSSEDAGVKEIAGLLAVAGARRAAAAVEGAWETARGFQDLAEQKYWSAAMHFIAAAEFFIVAGRGSGSHHGGGGSGHGGSGGDRGRGTGAGGNRDNILASQAAAGASTAGTALVARGNGQQVTAIIVGPDEAAQHVAGLINRHIQNGGTVYASHVMNPSYVGQGTSR